MKNIKEEIIEKVMQDYKEDFGEDFKLWSEYGWWLEEIDQILSLISSRLPKEFPAKDNFGNVILTSTEAGWNACLNEIKQLFK